MLVISREKIKMKSECLRTHELSTASRANGQGGHKPLSDRMKIKRISSSSNVNKSRGIKKVTPRATADGMNENENKNIGV